MAQASLFDRQHVGDLDLFLRYDLVSLGAEAIQGRATQHALRTGFNYNLPYTNKLTSLHVEYALSTVAGPSAIVTGTRTANEFRLGLRVSLQQYVRH